MAKKYSKVRAKKIANDHLENLEKLISIRRATDKSLAQRYLIMARRISRKFKIPLSRPLKRQYCKHCYTLLTPGYNSRIRLRSGMRVMYCESCKKYTRVPYKK